jgi:hypothetical protein
MNAGKHSSRQFRVCKKSSMNKNASSRKNARDRKRSSAEKSRRQGDKGLRMKPGSEKDWRKSEQDERPVRSTMAWNNHLAPQQMAAGLVRIGPNTVLISHPFHLDKMARLWHL